MYVHRVERVLWQNSGIFGEGKDDKTKRETQQDRERESRMERESTLEIIEDGNIVALFDRV